MIVDRLSKVAVILSFVMVALSYNVTWGAGGDKESHPPPSSGTYTYSPWGSSSCSTGTFTFSPGSSGFIGAGSSFVDPIFGERVKRISDGYSASDGGRHVSYSAKLVINANNTKALLQQVGGSSDGAYIVYDLSSGRELRKIGGSAWGGGGPYNENWQWHPKDPDKIVFITGNQIKEYSFAGNATSIVASRSSQLKNGGTGEFVDQSGRYYAVLSDNRTDLNFYDRNENVWYSGGATNLSGVDYIAIGPDGSGVLVVGNKSTGWYPVNHSTNSIGQVNRITDATPHGDIVKDSAGKIWFVCESAGIHPSDPNCKGCDGSKLIKIDVTNAANNVTLVDYGSNWDAEHHISCNVDGAGRDWCAVSEVQSDSCDSDPWTPWNAFKQEIFLVNVTSGAVKRLAHHRSRDPKSNYYRQPKVSLSIDGSVAIFNSNMGRVSSSYIDAYTVTTGISGGSAPPAPAVDLLPPNAPPQLRNTSAGGQ